MKIIIGVCVLLAGASSDAVWAFSPAPPKSPDPNRVELGYPVTRTEFAQNDEIGEGVAICRGHEAVVGLAVRSGAVIDRIDILCKDVNDLRNAAAPTNRIYFSGGTGGEERVFNAPTGYTLSAIETQSCDFNGKMTIGSLRPIYRGASKWGMHSARIPGEWVGGECGRGSPSSPHDAGTSDDVVSLECTQNGGSLQHAMVGLVGSDANYVENMAAFCKPLLPIADKPKFKSWRVSDAGFVSVPDQTPTLLGNHRCQSPMEGYVVDARSPFYATYGLWIEDLWRVCSTPVILPGFDFWYMSSPNYPDGLSPVDSKHKSAYYSCDDNYVTTGMFGWQDSDRLRDTGLTCTAIDLENVPNTGSALLPETSYSAGGFFNPTGKYFNTSCADGSLVTGYEDAQGGFSLPQDPNAIYYAVSEFEGVYCGQPQVLFK